MEVMFWVWLAIIAISLIIEIITLDLVSVWFACGAIIPFILAAIGGIYVEIQISVFVVVTALLFIFVRKYAQKLLFKNMDTKTNVDSLVGKQFRLLEDTDFEKLGSIKINDVVWTAISIDGSEIKKNSLVEVVKIDGNKLIVKEVQNKVAEEQRDKKIEIDENKEDNKSKHEIKDRIEGKQEGKNSSFEDDKNEE